jgi:hypothetical protein
MQPFMDIRGLTPQPGRLKCVWVPGADGRLESVWVPDWEGEADVTPLPKTQPVRQTKRKAS